VNELILVEERPAAGRQYPLRADMTIGRADCDIELEDSEVSRRHATIRMIDDGVVIEDLSSTNGTHVNGQRITGVTRLQQGATIAIGNAVWRVEPRVEAAVPPNVPAQAGGGAPFTDRRQRRGRGSAARMVEATVVSYAVVLATAVALVVYFAQR
jgi:predicted component of type VI protein secretion system